MRLTHLTQWFLPGVLALICGVAQADLLPPGAEDAVKRIQKNPKAFDRTDQFCTDKVPGDACTISGSRLAGGSRGVCSNEINRTNLTIDLSCNRQGFMNIDRGLPEGGFVAAPELCASGGMPGIWSCTPLTQTPVDRFCQGKSVNDACVVSMTYEGVSEQHEGICREVTQREGFYFRGRHLATRQVVLCDGLDKPAVRTYQNVPWIRKLWQ